MLAALICGFLSGVIVALSVWWFLQRVPLEKEAEPKVIFNCGRSDCKLTTPHDHIYSAREKKWRTQSCPVHGCQISRKHSHLNDLIRRIKDS